jgi:hypothetical protein
MGMKMPDLESMSHPSYEMTEFFKVRTHRSIVNASLSIKSVHCHPPEVCFEVLVDLYLHFFPISVACHFPN